MNVSRLKCLRQHPDQEADHHETVVMVDPDQDQVATVQFLTPLSPAAPSLSKAAAGAFFAALPSCLMSEAFTGERDSEDYLQQFTTAARLLGWQTATTDN